MMEQLERFLLVASGDELTGMPSSLSSKTADIFVFLTMTLHINNRHESFPQP